VEAPAPAWSAKAVTPPEPSSTAAVSAHEIVIAICFFTVELYHTFKLFVN